MPKPTINAPDDLRGQMSRGAVGGTSPNVMPGPSALGGSPGRTPGAGGSGGVKGIPARNGGIAVSKGNYGQRTGSPAPAAPVTPGAVSPKALGGASKAGLASMLSHGRTLGAVAHLHGLNGGGAMHPMLKQHHAKASAGIASYKNSMKNAAPAGPSFGSLGGSAVPGAGPQAPAQQPLGMAKVPDEM